MQTTMFISEENLKVVTAHGIIFSYSLFSCLKTHLREKYECHSNNILYYYTYQVIDWLIIFFSSPVFLLIRHGKLCAWERGRGVKYEHIQPQK